MSFIGWEVLQKSSKELWFNFWVGYLIAALYIPFVHLQVMYLCWLEMESQKYKKKKKDFFSNLEMFSSSFMKTESMAAYFLPFSGPCLANISKCTKLFAITWVSTALHPPHVLVSALTVPTAHQCLVIAEWWVRVWGWAGPQYELCWVMCGQRAVGWTYLP